MAFISGDLFSGVEFDLGDEARSGQGAWESTQGELSLSIQEPNTTPESITDGR
jgi:hypothetical protein